MNNKKLQDHEPKLTSIKTSTLNFSTTAPYGQAPNNKWPSRGSGSAQHFHTFPLLLFLSKVCVLNVLYVFVLSFIIITTTDADYGHRSNSRNPRSGRYFNFYEQFSKNPYYRQPNMLTSFDSGMQNAARNSVGDVTQLGNNFLDARNTKSMVNGRSNSGVSSLKTSLRAENERRLLARPPYSNRITLPGRLRAIIPFGGRPDLTPQPQQQHSEQVLRRYHRHHLSPGSSFNPVVLGPLISASSLHHHNDDSATESAPEHKTSHTLQHSQQQQCPTTYGNSSCVFQRECPLRHLIFSTSCTVRLAGAGVDSAHSQLPGGVCCLQPGSNAAILNSPYLITVPTSKRIKIKLEKQTPKPPTTTQPPTSTSTTTLAPLVPADEPQQQQSARPQLVVEPASVVHVESLSRPSVADAGANIVTEFDISLPLPVPPQPPTFAVTDNSPQAIRDRKIEANFLDINQCGRAPLEEAKNKGRNSRIIGGTATHYGQWPYFALLLNYRRPRCGGALINSEYMLTAAHCVAGDISNYDLTVNLGDYDLRTNSDLELAMGELPSETFNIRKVYRHPAFERQTLRNDIALLRLDKKVVFKPHIQPVCLPQREYWGVTGTVLGLGKQNENDPNNRLPTRLKKVELPIIKRDKCRRYFRKYEIDDMIMDMHICAGGIRDQDACQGDSGGPMAVQVGRHNELVGMVSFGWGCGQPNVPGVYSNIFHFRDWIINTIVDNMDN